MASIALAVAATWVGAPAHAAATTPLPTCQPASRPMVDVLMSYQNAADFAADDHVWANDTALRHVRMWRLAHHRFCVTVDDVGTFTTYAGVSPEGTGTVSAGVRGVFSVHESLTITGRFVDGTPRHGYIGNFDQQCTPDGECPGPHPRPDLIYFAQKPLPGLDFGPFAARYHAPGHGTWVQADAGDTGDITG